MAHCSSRSLLQKIVFAGTLALLSYSSLYSLIPAQQHCCLTLMASARRTATGNGDCANSYADSTPGHQDRLLQQSLPVRGNQSATADIQCTKLLIGDQDEVAKAKALVASGVSSGEFRRAADADDARMVNITCSELLASGYARESASDVEASFPLAFGIRFYHRPSQAELLLRTIYAPQNLYCLFVDPAAPANVQAAARRLAECLSNVHVAIPTERRFVYGSISPLLADLSCMRLLLRPPARASGGGGRGTAASGSWRYFINLTGQELPLKTNYELVRLLMLYNGSNELESEPGNRFQWRYASSFWCRDADDQVVKCPEPRTIKPPLPLKNITIYKGLAYGYFSRSLVEFVVRMDGVASVLLSWFNDTYSPDENYWATLNRLPDAPGSYVGPKNISPSARAVSWAGVSPCHGRIVRQVCIFGVGDLSWLMSRHEAFANKFSVDTDPIAAQCISEYVIKRRENEPHENSWLVPWYWHTYLELPQISPRS